MRHRRCALALFLTLHCLSLFACATDHSPLQPDEITAPAVTELSANEISVGDPIAFFGSGFAEPHEGWTDVHFTGVFSPDDGSPSNNVDFSVALSRGLDGALTWERFGGYRVPFLPAGNKLGHFSGAVYATNHYFDESRGPEQQEANWARVELTVGPSLVVLDNRAVGEDFVADCAEPSTVMLQRMSYALRVKALGFEPTRFGFVTTPGLLQANPAEDAWLVNTEPASFDFDSVEGDERAILHRWTPAPAFTTGYQAGITAVASGAETEKRIHFPFIVRPWTYPAFEELGELAEIHEAQAVSGCIDGGPSSIETSYSEAVSETRGRSLQSSLFADVDTVFHEDFSDTYNHEERPSFLENATPTVILTDLTAVVPSSSSSDLFSSSSQRERRETLAWEPTQDGETLSVRSEDGAGIESFLEYRDAGADEITQLLAGFEENASDGNPMGIGTTFGILVGRNRVGPTSVLTTNEPREPYSLTVHQNRQRGRTWGMARTYREQTGMPLTRSLNQVPTFGEAFQTTTSVAEELGWVEADVLAQSSSELISEGLAGRVWANQQGMWFRQLTRIVHRGKAVALDLCGNGAAVGDVEASEWSWAVDLAIGDTCPPPTNFPPAACRSAACTDR